MSMKVDDNGRPKLSASFGEIEWGPKARGWSQSTSRLSAEQWRIITAEATARSNKLAQGDPNGEDNGEIDPRRILDLYILKCCLAHRFRPFFNFIYSYQS